MKSLFSFFLTVPQTWIVWLLNQSFIKSILKTEFAKKYLKANSIKWLSVTVAIVLIAFDVRLVEDGVDGNTWSELMRTYGQRFWVLPWLCGVLIGHLYHLHDDRRPIGRLEDKQAYNLIFWLTVAITVLGFLAQGLGDKITEWLMTGVAVLGYATGHFIWPIKREADKWTW